MANWMIQCADRYLGILYDRLGPQWGQVLESWDKSSVKRV